MEVKRGEIPDNRPKIWVSLPVPDAELMSILTDSGEKHAYLDCISKIAKMESEAIVTTAKIKYGALFKVLLIITCFLSLVIGLVLGNQINLKFGNTGVSTSPQKSK